ncbi:hypothetical protein Ate02nite_21720 [Paractinoplanes tereljensis]|uniref:DUF1707 domain-containing protein n=1 Tax=Paractinoplanes tereljensis TaxID=571912 RepID=A0A919NKB6_9ACTN|nr:hypothetical protein Ate02nite_21720 [Actinoplanes tereljensis]
MKSALEEGRLDLSEYDERLQGAYAARTYGDLDRLLTDLPNAAPVVPAPPQAVAVPAANATRHWLAHVWVPYLRAAAFFTVIWATGSFFSSDSDASFYWPVWILGPWGVLTVLRTLAGLTQGEPRKHAATEEHRRMLREHRQERKQLYRKAIAAGELPANPTKDQRKAFIAEATRRGDLAPKPRLPEN